MPTRTTTPAIKALQALTNPNFHGNAATRHGLKHEQVTRSQFQTEYGLVVEKRGTHVNEENTWLSATPDGIVEGYNAILETKCPFIEDCNDLEAWTRPSENGPNDYYGQVQLTMFCTRPAMCFFFTCGR